ncbi:hypothetical protein [Kitasatospora camelliae]|uniref:Uncharacterized protein n=1 Tax=Kitasatospora camelliae TaxID=3156397 RepID=A0AAU8JRQ6_9ACTN
MSHQWKKTLTTLLQGVAVIAALCFLWRGRGSAWSDIALWAGGLGVLHLLISAYAWWFYGESARAVALRAKAEEKKAARSGRLG